MKCPICNGPTRTLESRPVENKTRRRKECQSCFTRFTTLERIQIDSIDKHLLEKYMERLSC